MILPKMQFSVLKSVTYLGNITSRKVVIAGKIAPKAGKQ
jgi:hypothetical protein